MCGWRLARMARMGCDQGTRLGHDTESRATDDTTRRVALTAPWGAVYPNTTRLV